MLTLFSKNIWIDILWAVKCTAAFIYFAYIVWMIGSQIQYENLNWTIPK